jgi:chromosome segregation ATPase
VEVADDVSSGEVFRRLKDHEERTERVHAALDGRITEVARDMVPLSLYQQTQRDQERELQRLESEHDEAVQDLRKEHQADISAVRGEVADLRRETRERPQMTLSRWLGVLGVVAAYLTLAVMAWQTMRGSK